MFLLQLFLVFIPILQIGRADDDDQLDYSTLFKVSPRQDKNFTELTAYDGYETEEFFVTTEDGYILGVYHFKKIDGCDYDATEPLIFQHGLYLSGMDCIIPGPNKAHCYIYVDNCYDVWVANNRGNRYSRNHTTYNPDTDSKFWDFAFDEMATYDTPAIIDFVLEKTGKSQVSYLSHSQGFTLLLLLCAERPEYNDKIKLGFAMSPTAWLDYSQFIVVELQGILSPLLTASNVLGINSEFLAYGGITQKTGRLLCGASKLEYPICTAVIFAALGYDKFQITDEVLPVVVSNTPAGTSLKDFTRWGQIKDNGFTKFDYGFVKNLLTYGQASPPVFDLTNVTMKWVYLTSYNDYVGNPRNLPTLYKALTSNEVSEECRLTDTTFAHLDFIYGKDIPNTISKIILAYLQDGAYEGSAANCTTVNSNTV